MFSEHLCLTRKPKLRHSLPSSSKVNYCIRLSLHRTLDLKLLLLRWWAGHLRPALLLLVNHSVERHRLRDAHHQHLVPRRRLSCRQRSHQRPRRYLVLMSQRSTLIFMMPRKLVLKSTSHPTLLVGVSTRHIYQLQPLHPRSDQEALVSVKSTS